MATDLAGIDKEREKAREKSQEADKKSKELLESR